MNLKHSILLVTAFLTAMTANAFKLTRHTGEVADGYNFLLAEPDTVDGPKPVVIFLHGASLRGNDLNKVKRYGTIDAMEKGRQIDAYVVAPQVSEGSWNPQKIMNVLDWVRENRDVDNNRIYVLGMSLGGYGTLDFAATYPDQIAAAIGICGGATRKDLSGLAHLPLWIIHGTGDHSVSVEQSDKVVDAIADVDPDLTRLIYDRVTGMNHSQPARVFYVPAVYDWLFLHSLDEEGRPLHETIHVDNSLLRNAYKGIGSKPKGSARSTRD